MVMQKSVILVVEDEKESRDTLQELLDLFMPVMSGWQVIEKLRAEGRLDQTQIVVITSAPHIAPTGLPVFQKPLDLDKVMHEVQRLC
jgi:CheY-like chemotaxis protein